VEETGISVPPADSKDLAAFVARYRAENAVPTL
jgi:hypothetical protein